MFNQQPVSVRSPKSFTEIKQAYSLVYREYRQAGYMESNASKMRYSVHQVLGALSQTYLAFCGKVLVGTGSTVLHSSAGLPSCNIFSDEIQCLTQQGRLVAEGTLLACRPHGDVKAQDVSRELIRYGISWCLANAADDFIVVVNPKHLRFWHEVLGFEVLSNPKSCPQVKNAPGHLVRLDLEGIRTGRIKATPTLQAEVLDRLLAGRKLNCWFELTERNVFELLNANPSILINITDSQYGILGEIYPQALAAAEEILAKATFTMRDRKALLKKLGV